MSRGDRAVSAFLTLRDGVLVDIEGDAATITIRAGRSLVPTERPIVLMVTLLEAIEFRDTLLGVIEAIMSGYGDKEDGNQDR
jgi:hypothetical protein